jgi:hypothetical protein
VVIGELEQQLQQQQCASFLIALPFNFSTSVFDAIAPHAGSERFALVSNVFQLFLGEQYSLSETIAAAAADVAR